MGGTFFAARVVACEFAARTQEPARDYFSPLTLDITTALNNDALNHDKVGHL